MPRRPCAEETTSPTSSVAWSASASTASSSPSRAPRATHGCACSRRSASSPPGGWMRAARLMRSENVTRRTTRTTSSSCAHRRPARPHPAAMARLDDDWDDVLACMDWRLGRNEYTKLVQLVSRTWRYIWLRDRVREVTAVVAEAYAARASLEPTLRGELCRLWGSGRYQSGEYDAAREAIEEAVRLLSEHGPKDREAWARTLLGGLLPYYDRDLRRASDEVSRRSSSSARSRTSSDSRRASA